jgi:bifunctional non-homologous end joining protein LigD
MKIKSGRREEFVIVGWDESDKHGRAFASLLLAQRENGRLVYKGKVGTGFDEETAEDIARQFKRLATTRSPLASKAGISGKPHWLKPELVAEVRFAELTRDGVVRHAAFLGLREDKPAEEVTPEVQGEEPVSGPESLPRADFTITNPDRELFNDGGPTKGDLAAWYQAIAPHALEWMANRPLSLVRCPQGAEGQCFFQKHLKDGWGDELDSVMVREKDGEEPYIVARDVSGLLRCVQMGTIEFHGWGAPARAIECPDRLVFDLDPDVGLDFGHVKKAARLLHEHLGEMGLVTFPMVTGGKGVHVIAPLDGSADWDAVEDFAHRFALALEQAEPDRFTASMSKARRKGRIFLDWLRNQRGSTAVMPWSVRARDHAPVATPITWDELGDLEAANLFTLEDPGELLDRAKSLDPGWCRVRQALPGT